MFVIIMYDTSSSAASIEDARLDLFAWKQRSYESIILSRGALSLQSVQFITQDALRVRRKSWGLGQGQKW
jgi:hypothetical protein